MQKLENGLDHILDAILQRVPSIVLGIIVLIIGSYLVRIILRIVRNRFEKNKVELSLRDFIMSLLKFILYAMLLLSAASTMGLQTTSFLAVLSAASLAVGLSLQGSLSNFAGGVLILLFRPFRVGDAIDSTNGASGTIEHIDILYTTLRKADGITVFAPNGPLANSIITNYSNIQSRRIEYKLDISDKSDIKAVRSVILDVLREDTRILPHPAPQVLVNQLSPNTVNLLIQAWASKNDYGNAFYENQENLKEALATHHIAPPTPQTEIRLYQDSQGRQE